MSGHANNSPTGYVKGGSYHGSTIIDGYGYGRDMDAESNGTMNGADENNGNQLEVGQAVAYSGSVHLLGLRGGGGGDRSTNEDGDAVSDPTATVPRIERGAGVYRWLLDEDCDGPSRSGAERDGERAMQGRVAASPPQPVAEAQLEGEEGARPQRVIISLEAALGERRRISIHEALGGGVEPGGPEVRGCQDEEDQVLQGRPAPATQMITGEWQGVRVVVCQRCCRDVVEAEWRSHRCGADQSEEDEQQTDGVAGWERENFLAWNDWHAGEHDEAVREYGGGEQAQIRCVACGLDSAEVVGAQWRVCRCGATACLACAGYPCSDCPALTMGAVAEQGAMSEAVQHRGGRQADSEKVEMENAGAVMQRRSTPDVLGSARKATLEAIKEELTRRREKTRRERKEQVRRGDRPRRPRADQ